MQNLGFARKQLASAWAGKYPRFESVAGRLDSLSPVPSIDAPRQVLGNQAGLRIGPGQPPGRESMTLGQSTPGLQGKGFRGGQGRRRSVDLWFFRPIVDVALHLSTCQWVPFQ